MDRFRSTGFARTYLLPVILLFAVPAVGLWFADHAIDSVDADVLAAVEDSVQSDATLTAAEREEILASWRAVPVSALCLASSSDAPGVPSELAPVCSDVRQFGWIRTASVASIALAVFSLLFVLVASLVAFVSRPAQYASFVAGWGFLRLAGVGQLLLQGFLLVMLSFWLTAFFTDRYYPKLILVVGIAVLAAVVLLVAAIFKKVSAPLPVEGEELDEARAPELWARIREICARVGTAPPDRIVAGIDDNFFVTEGEILRRGAVLDGRTLYVSLALLRTMERSEADAVLAHEMGHFAGGDTEHSKRLGPLLTRFDDYLDALYQGLVSRPIFYLMLLYRALFQLALSRSRRERELAADRVAAEVTSPLDVARALLKVGAYSSYRGRVEEALFEHAKLHEDLGIAARVARGFASYAETPKLAFDLHEAHFPHPFDSHPPLEERMASVGAEIPGGDYAAVLTAPVASSWTDVIADADAIERSLWDAYEARFAEAHDLDLAYRYLPTTPEEVAHVEKHFPPLVFERTDGGPAVHLRYDAIDGVDDEGRIAFDAIAKLRVDDGTFGKTLVIELKDAGMLSRGRRLKLKQLAGPKDGLLDALNRYYGRHLAARQPA